MKKAVARELLWFFGAVIVAVPVALLFHYLTVKEPLTDATEPELVLEMELLIIGGLLGFVGTYFMRAVMWAVILLLTKE